MDDTFVAILIAAAVAVAIPLSAGVIFYINLAYRKDIIRQRLLGIEYRAATKKLDRVMNNAATPDYEQDYKKEWNIRHELEIQVSLDKDEIYEEELSRDQLQAFGGILKIIPKQ